MSLDREEGSGRSMCDKEGYGHSSNRPKPIISWVGEHRPRKEALSLMKIGNVQEEIDSVKAVVRTRSKRVCKTMKAYPGASCAERRLIRMCSDIEGWSIAW